MQGVCTSLTRSKHAPKYSGPNCSGTCQCGHSWEDHHLSMVMRQEYIEDTKEVYIPEECLFYGCNEAGGLDAEGNEHCWKYRDEKWPDEHN